MNQNKFTIQQGQAVLVTVTPETAGGKAVALAGKPNWSVKSGDCTLGPISEDGLSAYVIAGSGGTTASPVSSFIYVTAEGDPQPGEDTVSVNIQIDVVNAEASQLIPSFAQAIDAAAIPAPTTPAQTAAANTSKDTTGASTGDAAAQSGSTEGDAADKQ